MKYFNPVTLFFIFIFILSTFIGTNTFANPIVIKHKNSSAHLKIEFLENRGLHFEIAQYKLNSDRIYTTPMVLKDQLNLSAVNKINDSIYKNENFEININLNSLCIKVKDLKQNWEMLETCPLTMTQGWKGLSFNGPETKNLYGLGQYFINPGSADGDLTGRIWDPLATSEGNSLRYFSKGANSYAMFPVLYGLGNQNQNYFIFYDNIYKQLWNLKTKPFSVKSFGDELRWFIYTSDNVKNLRRQYMNITGKAPVPPKDVFGVWVSEFGYESWDEIDGELKKLRKESFPIDGFSLDLQWFGGDFFEGNSDRSSSRFGTLEFDTHNFPNPKEKIQHYLNHEGVSLMPIEESYISKFLPEHGELASQGYMAKWCGTNSATELTANPWWGIGGMIDWTNPNAGNFWHDRKRKKMIEMGLTHHWTDLGEPEMYHPNSCYFGFPQLNKHKHSDVHNIYNFKWLESIARGYKRNQNTERPFMMSRSGTAGVQRFGAAMWSGDIGANMNAMTAHYNAQMHMTFSGVDYYGADIGGFHRRAGTLDGDANELFTQWFANAALFDFPIRSHTWNLSNQLETSPASIGKLESNRFNARLRYRLFPYYYSLAHAAFKTGDAIIRPMALEFPKNLELREVGHQKMIGPYLMGALVAGYGEASRNVYLPKGEWFDFHTGQHYHGNNKFINNVSNWQEGVFRVPLFVKSGAIIPTMYVDEKTQNISGKRRDGSKLNQIDILVAASSSKSHFTLIDDDGKTIAYKTGGVERTEITQKQDKNILNVFISKTLNSLNSKKTKRVNLSILTTGAIKSVSLTGVPITMCVTGNNLNCFRQTAENKYLISVDNVKISDDKFFKITF